MPSSILARESLRLRSARPRAVRRASIRYLRASAVVTAAIKIHSRPRLEQLQARIKAFADSNCDLSRATRKTYIGDVSAARAAALNVQNADQNPSARLRTDGRARRVAGDEPWT